MPTLRCVRTALFIHLALPWLVQAQPAPATLHVDDPAAVAALNALDRRINALSAQVSVCVERKLAPPDACFCRYPAEVQALNSELQDTLRRYPAWSTRAVSWTETRAGEPVGHTIAIAHVGPQLARCKTR